MKLHFNEDEINFFNSLWDFVEIDTNNNHHPMMNKKYVEDMSNFSFPNEIWIRKSDFDIGLRLGLMLPVAIAGIIGNIVLIYIIFTNRSLRTPTNLLIGNMAVADLLVLLFCPWIFLMNDFYQNYVLGEIGCRTEGFIECSLLLASVMSLSTISYDRVTAIVLPRETRLTRRSAKIIMALTWIVSITISTPLIIYRKYKERYWINFYEKYCTENRKVLPIYWHLILALLVWCPLGIMLICYSAIFIKLDQYEQQVLKREHPILVSYKTRVARMVFIVVITFIICRVPFTALIFIRGQMFIKNEPNQVNGAFRILWFISKCLIYFNAAVNPLIYGLTNENFRRVIRSSRFLKCILGPVKKPPPRIVVRVLEPREPCGKQFDVSWLNPNTTNNKLLVPTNASSLTGSPNISTKIVPVS